MPTKRKKYYMLGDKSLHIETTQINDGNNKKKKFISLFSGAMGLDLGLEMSGFELVGCLEIDKWACETIRKNRPDLPLIQDDIKNWDGDSLLSNFNVSPEEICLVVGGPPCPSFSTAGRRRSFDDPRGQLMFDFLRIINEISPSFFVMENVPGILSASLKHRPLDLRSREYGDLSEEELNGSVMKLLDDKFKEIGYLVTAELVNSADYGVPQKRERVIFIGNKYGYQVSMPPGFCSNNGNMFHKPWTTLGDVINDLENDEHEFIAFSDTRLKYLKWLNEGENWRKLPKELQKEAMGGAYLSGGGKVGFYRRLSFDKPSPTLPTSPVQKSTCLCHPKELRPLSVNEYKRIQQFPEDWEFVGSTSNKYKQIGNAVPVGLAAVIGETISKFI